MINALAVVSLLAAFEPQPPSPYAIDYVFDSTLTLGSFATLLMLHEVAGGSLDNAYICSEAHPDTQCNPSTVNRFDRGAIHNHSKTWDAVGTYGLFAIIGGAAVGSALDNALSGSSSRMRGFAADVMVIAESTSMATLTTHIIRYGVRRSRPTQYVGGNADIDMAAQERHLSFPSGHATSAAAISTSFATTFWLRHPESPWRWVVASGSVVAAGLAGYGRVGAGRHFPSDIIAGQLIGTAFGILVPLTHRADVSIAVSAGDTKAMTISGKF